MNRRPKTTWWELECRLLTPAFIGGATPRQADVDLPFRPASLRGVLRHWFRMGMADVLGGGEPDGDRPQSLAALRRLEVILFGATEAGSRLLVKPPRGGEVRPMPPFDPRSDPGLSYLSYGLFARGISTALIPGRDIALWVGLRPQSQDTEEQRKALRRALHATLWLWANLGGVGARTRRGWGAVELRLKDGPADESLLSRESASNSKALLQELNSGLGQALAGLRALAQTFGFNPTLRGRKPLLELRTLAGLAGFRALPETYRTSLEAMSAAGRLFQDFRSTLRRNAHRERPLEDYFYVKEALVEGRPPRAVPRAAFGMPLPFYFRSLGNRKAWVLPTPPRTIRFRAKVDRLPSALLFRVHRLSDGRYVMLLLDLDEAAPAPLGGCALRFQGLARDVDVPAPDRKLVAQFLAFATSRPGGRR